MMQTEQISLGSTHLVPPDVTERFKVIGLVEVEGDGMRPMLRNGDLAAIVEGGTMTRDTPAMVKLTNGKTFMSFVRGSDDPDFLVVDDTTPKATVAGLLGKPLRRSDVEGIHPIVGVIRRSGDTRYEKTIDLGNGKEWVWMHEPGIVAGHPEADEACRVVVSGELTDFRIPVEVRARFPRAFGVLIVSPLWPPYQVGDVVIVCPDCTPETIDNAVLAVYLETAQGGEICFGRDAGDHYIVRNFAGESDVRIAKADVIRRGVPIGILRPDFQIHRWIGGSGFNPDVRNRERVPFREAIAKTDGKVVRLA